jgi:sugar transferase EpsL
MPRIFDLLVLFVALPVVLPVLLVLALLVWLRMGRPIFFTQMRGGHKGVPFALYKFRTMTNARDAKGELLPDAQRLTKLGRFLRAASADELPSLLNLLRGDIRLVGPRPFLAEYLPLYSPEQMRRHDAVPGITGWAQVMGRNSLTWGEKFALDIWYVDNRSALLDLKIMFLTAIKVVNREGVNASEDETMPYFTETTTTKTQMSPVDKP